MSRHRILQILFFTYCLLLAITLWQHEMWRDELQAWNIAATSASFADLFHNIQYEGHPLLWFIILWLLSKISAAPEMMQVINFVFAAITVWLVLFRSPFTTLQKALLVFGYYFFYEYAAISRNYMIELVMVAMICSMWNDDVKKNKNILLLLLFLLCQTNSYGYILSIALAFALFVRELTQEKSSVIKASLFLFAAAAGFALAYVTSAPPRDSEFYLPIHISFDQHRFFQTFTNCWNAFVPLPRFKFPFWSEALLKPSLTGSLLGIGMLLFIIFISFRQKKLLLTFLLPAFLGMLAFMYFKYPGFQRHYGHLFIAFVAFLWISQTSGEVARESFSRLKFSFFNIILVIQFFIGISFMIADWIFPFSNGKPTAEYIRKNYPSTTTVTGFTDCPAVTIAGYMERDLYFLNNLRDAPFVIYKTSRLAVDDSDIYRNLFELADSSKLLVAALNFNLQVNGHHFLPGKGRDTSLSVSIHGAEKKFLVRNRVRFEGGMVGGEDFTVYEIREE